MPAPQLQRHGVACDTTSKVIVPAVPALRALVVSKLTVASNAAPAGAAVTFTLTVGPAAGPKIAVAQNVTLNPGDVYAESGLVLAPGDELVANVSTANVVGVTVCGQEVDRG